MTQFIAQKDFFDLFPDAHLGILLVKDIPSSDVSPQEVKDLLEEANEEAKKFLVEDQLSQNPVVAVWREAYKKFKTKKGARCSIEALLKRVQKGNPVGSILPLVDIYNATSLKFGLPCGAEDIDKFQGDLQLTVTEGGDPFGGIGDEGEETLPGELCYKDDAGAVCRCFNWRDSERTMITETTKNAFMIFELTDGERLEDLKAALDFAKENLEKYLGATVTSHILTKEGNSLALS